MDGQAQQREQSVQEREEEAEAQLSKKMICRYGRGCTHIHDVVHREKFWHPPVPRLSADEIERKCICNECGMAFDTLTELQSHLIRKTAWSNHGLCGCRVSLLLDNKQWYEGIVLRFEKGRHLVQIRTLDDQYGERRWLNMQKVAFYVVELPDCPVNEVKEPEDAITLGDGEDETWTYAEDITLEYAYAQWMLYRLYGNKIQETGHKTKGHVCLTDQDKELAKLQKGSLLYGELLPRGVNKALDSCHLDGKNARVLFDLGMGTGKVAIQAFLQFRNLQYVYGVELSAGRYAMAEAAVVRLAIMNPHTFELRRIPGKSVCLVERIGIQPQFQANTDTKQEEDASPRNVFDPTDLNNVRVLHLVHGDMLQTPHMDLVDIVMLETDVPSELHKELCRLLAKTKDGCRALTYLDLDAMWSSHSMPFRQLETNRLLTDRFPTSWSVQRGHHFYMWMNSRSNLNPFRRNSHDGLTKHNKFATRCAKFFARLFPSKHRTRTKYKSADCIIPFDASPTQSNAGSPSPAVEDVKDDRLLQVMFNIITVHPLCEKPEELSIVDLSDAPQQEHPPAHRFSPSLTEDWFETESREGDAGCDSREAPAAVQGDGSVQTGQTFSNLALDTPDDCKYGPHHAAPATAAVADDQTCSVS